MKFCLQQVMVKSQVKNLHVLFNGNQKYQPSKDYYVHIHRLDFLSRLVQQHFPRPIHFNSLPRHSTPFRIPSSPLLFARAPSPPPVWKQIESSVSASSRRQSHKRAHTQIKMACALCVLDRNGFGYT